MDLLSALSLKQPSVASVAHRIASLPREYDGGYAHARAGERGRIPCCDPLRDLGGVAPFLGVVWWIDAHCLVCVCVCVYTYSSGLKDTHGYLGCLVDVCPLVEQQLDQLEVAVRGG